jgi:hypothetical protein
MKRLKNLKEYEMKVTVRNAMIDLREVFIGKIFKHYPDHKKMWKAEEVDKEFTSAMYEMSMYYLEELERKEDAKT